MRDHLEEMINYANETFKAVRPPRLSRAGAIRTLREAYAGEGTAQRISSESRVWITMAEV